MRKAAGCSLQRLSHFLVQLAVIAATIFCGGICMRWLEDAPAAAAGDERQAEIDAALAAANLTSAQVRGLSAAGVLTTAADLSPWTLSGSCFFCLTCATTIGYGTFAPVTWQGRVFAVTFSVIGIVIVGYCMTEISGMLISAMMRLAQKAAMCLNPYPRIDAEGELTSASHGLLGEWFQRFDTDCSGALDRGQLICMLTVMNDGQAVEPAVVDIVVSDADLNQDGVIQEKEVEEAVKAWYRALPESPKDQTRVQFLFACALGVANIVLFAHVFEWVEAWDMGDAYWFTVVTATTVGFGDVAPQTVTGEVLVYVFTATGLSTLAYILGTVAELVQMEWNTQEIAIEVEEKVQSRKNSFKERKRTWLAGSGRGGWFSQRASPTNMFKERYVSIRGTYQSLEKLRSQDRGVVPASSTLSSSMLRDNTVPTGCDSAQEVQLLVPQPAVVEPGTQEGESVISPRHLMPTPPKLYGSPPAPPTERDPLLQPSEHGSQLLGPTPAPAPAPPAPRVSDCAARACITEEGFGDAADFCCACLSSPCACAPDPASAPLAAAPGAAPAPCVADCAVRQSITGEGFGDPAEFCCACLSCPCTCDAQ